MQLRASMHSRQQHMHTQQLLLQVVLCPCHARVDHSVAFPLPQMSCTHMNVCICWDKVLARVLQLHNHK